MSSNVPIDLSKSLAELTGIDWGEAPAGAGTLVRERHQIRRTPLCQLPEDAIVRFLDMGSDVDLLVPIALGRLRDNSEAIGLLCAVMRAELYDWRGRPYHVASLREQVSMAINQIGQITDDLERLELEARVWRFYAQFERGLAEI